MYMITRSFSKVKADGTRRRIRVIKRGLTRAEAVEYCRDPETSSSTATSEYRVRYTRKYGAWFDGFEEE